MSQSHQILAGLGLGVFVGLFFGEKAGVLQVGADSYVKLLQMTVLPYVMVSLIAGLGSLDYAQALALGLKAGAVLVGLWVLALLVVFLFPVLFPQIETASFFSTTLLEPNEPFDFISLYIPSNPFFSLANNVVPAVVLFSVLVGVALIGVPNKARVLDVLVTFNDAVSRATGFIVRLTPFGLFAIAATATGTLDLDQAARLQVYLVSYVAIALLVSLWILPGLVAVLTPIPYRAILASSRDALITAFMTSNLFIVLPILTEQSKALLRQHRLGETGGDALPDVIVPASFNFPHTAKLLTLSFILFAGWFADAAVPVREYPRLALAGLVTLFGSVNVAVPFLLDLFRIPADTFQLFLATGVINSRFGAMIAAMHTFVIALLGACAIVGVLQFHARRLARYIVMTAVLTALTLAGVRAFFAFALDLGYDKDKVLASMQMLQERGPAVVDQTPPALVPVDRGQSQLELIQARGTLRVGYLSDNLPFAYFNRSGALVGFDVEMAHTLARDLGVALRFVPIDRGALVDQLGGGYCDLVMSGVVVTTERARDITFSTSYMDETLAFIVRDDRREEFRTWNAVRQLGAITVGVPNLPYYVAKVRGLLPHAKIVLFNSIEEVFSDQGRAWDAAVLAAERGSAWTLLHPEYSVVLPGPGLLKIPLAYPIARRDQAWASVVNTWLELKRKDGTIQALYDYWILGRNAAPKKPRWSIMRNVLHWTD